MAGGTEDTAEGKFARLLERIAAAPPADPPAPATSADGAPMKACTRCGLRIATSRDRCPIDRAELEELPDPFIGRLLAGRYLVEARIGAGGMGSVYRARHRAIGRDVAIKVLHATRARSERQVERLLREAQASNRIRHENVVDISDFGETEQGQVYLVMEYLTGSSLGALLDKGPLEPGRAVHIASQVAKGLARAHEFDVIHRDVKPDNVFLVRRADYTDHVKLLDFGIAKLGFEVGITESGMTMGTPAYMSPEQARGSVVGPASDLYSLGCMLYEMLSGRRPFRGSISELLHRQVSEAPPPLRSLVAVPEALEQVILKLLHKQPEQRQRSAHEVVAELDALRSVLPAPTQLSARPAVPAPMPGPERRLEVDVKQWSERAQEYRRMGEAATGAQPVPAWVAESLDRVEHDLGSLMGLRWQLQEAAEAAADAEGEAHRTRLRIGAALDELVRDAERVEVELSGLREALQAARVQEEQAAEQLTRLTLVPGKASDALVDAARAFAEGRRMREKLERTLTTRTAHFDDLAFQMQQLKGRLGSYNASAHGTFTEGHDRTASLERDIALRQASIAEDMERLTGYLETVSVAERG